MFIHEKNIQQPFLHINHDLVISTLAYLFAIQFLTIEISGGREK